ncbi:tetratricopeptide repeat protein [Clostridium ljungdahlii]|uniref:Tetratricopeptide repeat protein n=1 Tax=Clostridium ljungdahlii TaxID=1538 RepID=A0A162LE65_9CLOT|nr:tetratricopeptide repeat protein [Clostridium ljungdahlii]OAA92366.1 Tetratricopeptide repeat protein [Clostridium ljungdahlii]
MDKSQKIYNKALKKYNDGYIDKAIELCEESISLNIKNRASINLKGLLFYLKGDLDKAQKLWKMNHQVNGDGVSEKYLGSLKEDDVRFSLYVKALRLIRELKINEALKLLEQCSESDFNYIKVNNYSALCYIKKGEYKNALEKLNNVLKVDIKNDEAKKTMKLLEDLNVVKKKFPLRKVVCISASIICSVVLIVLIFNGVKNKNLFNKNVAKVKTSAIKNSGQKASGISNKTKPKAETTKEVFPQEKFKGYLQNKDYDSIYIEVKKWKDKQLSTDEGALLSEGSNLLKQDGSAYFYKLGTNYLNSKDYNNAKAYLTKAYEFGSENYLYADIVYMLATTLDSSGDTKNAINYYIQYDKSFSDGDYEETVLYRLAVIYKDTDKSQAKKYAQGLVDKYPNSIYNNSIISNLIND